MANLLTTLYDLPAADDMAEGYKYADRVTAGNFSARSAAADSIASIISLLSTSLDTGLTVSNAAPVSNQISHKIVIKNDSLLILAPIKIEYSDESSRPNNMMAGYSKSLKVLYPGDQCTIDLIRLAPAGTYLTFNFCAITTDPEILKSQPPHLTEMPEIVLRIEFQPDRIVLARVTVDSETVTPSHPPTDMQNLWTTTYATYRGSHSARSRSPSFGIAFFETLGTRTLGFNLSNTLVFTPSGKRSDTPEIPANDVPLTPSITGPVGAYFYLLTCLKSYLKSTQHPHPRSIIGSIGLITSIIGLTSSAANMYSSLRARTGGSQGIILTMNNMTDYPMFLLRRKDMVSRQVGNGIIKPGLSLSTPFLPPQNSNADREFFFRVVLGKGRPNLDITLRIRDYGNTQFVKLSHVSYHNAGSFDDPGVDPNKRVTHNHFYRSGFFCDVVATLMTNAITLRNDGEIQLTLIIEE